jgi:hypothetical protein
VWRQEQARPEKVTIFVEREPGSHQRYKQLAAVLHLKPPTSRCEQKPSQKQRSKSSGVFPRLRIKPYATCYWSLCQTCHSHANVTIAPQFRVTQICSTFCPAITSAHRPFSLAAAEARLFISVSALDISSITHHGVRLSARTRSETPGQSFSYRLVSVDFQTASMLQMTSKRSRLHARRATA